MGGKVLNCHPLAVMNVETIASGYERIIFESIKKGPIHMAVWNPISEVFYII